MPEDGDLFDGLPYWPFTCDLARLHPMTYGDWKITALAMRVRLEPKGWPFFLWDFNLLWNDWPFELVTLLLSPELTREVESVQPAYAALEMAGYFRSFRCLVA